MLKFKGVVTFVDSQEKSNLRTPDLCFFLGGQLIYLTPKRGMFPWKLSFASLLFTGGPPPPQFMGCCNI